MAANDNVIPKPMPVAPEAEAPNAMAEPPIAAIAQVVKSVVAPTKGEIITSLATGNSYTIGDQIGEGNFGVVYGCTDDWENELAVKVLKPIGTYEKVAAAAAQEFGKLFLLRHPHVTFVYDAFEFRDTFYIVTERCAYPLTRIFSVGEGLAGPIWAMGIAKGLLQAVHYLHINKYVHQDIHPGNVFLAVVKDHMVPESPENVVRFKLGDLGVARFVTEVDATNTRAQWMLPPEVLNPSEFGVMDHRIDVYHVGLLLLQVLSKKELRFSNDEILAGKPREMALALPVPFNFALEKALRRHVQCRTASAMELWRDLHTPAVAPTQDASAAQLQSIRQGGPAEDTGKQE
jgi:serine/threonine-protein kinase